MILKAWKWTRVLLCYAERKRAFISTTRQPLSSLETGDFVELCYHGRPILGQVRLHEEVKPGSSAFGNYSVCLETGVECPLFLSDIKYQVRATQSSLSRGTQALEKVESSVSRWLSTHGDAVEDWLWHHATGKTHTRVNRDSTLAHSPAMVPGSHIYIAHLLPHFKSGSSDDWMIELALWRVLYYHSELMVKSPHYSFVHGGPFYFRSRQEREFVRRLQALLVSPIGETAAKQLKSILVPGTDMRHQAACSPEEALLLEALRRQATAHAHSDRLSNSPYYDLAKTLVPSEWHTNSDLYAKLDSMGLFENMSPSTIYMRQYCIEESNESHSSSTHGLHANPIPIPGPGPGPIFSLTANTDNRTNFEHLVAYALDSPDTIEVDDALSIEQNTDDASYTLYVHIADPTHYIHFNDPIERRMRAMNSTLYLPESKITLLPSPHLFTISLEQRATTSTPRRSHPTLTLIIKLDEQGHTLDYHIRLGWLQHIVRLSYEDSEMLLDIDSNVDASTISSTSEPSQLKASNELKMIHALMDKRFKSRVAAGHVPFDRPSPHLSLNEAGNRVLSITNDQAKSSKSKRLISESMILANHLTAAYAHERNITIPFRCQSAPTERAALELAEAFRQAYLAFTKATEPGKGSNSFFERPTTLSQLENLLTSLPKSQLSLRAEPHWAMNLSMYCRVTSPMRRYGDTLTHYLLKYYLQTGQTNGLLAPSALSELLVYSDEMEGRIKMIQKKTIRYWLLYHIASQPHDTEWLGTVLDASFEHGSPFTQVNTGSNSNPNPDPNPNPNFIKVYVPTLYTTFLVKWNESYHGRSSQPLKPDPYQRVTLRPSLILPQAGFIKWNILQIH